MHTGIGHTCKVHTSHQLSQQTYYHPRPPPPFHHHHHPLYQHHHHHHHDPHGWVSYLCTDDGIQMHPVAALKEANNFQCSLVKGEQR